MTSRSVLAAALITLLLAGCGGSTDSDRAVPQEPATKPDGDPVDGIMTARFDPTTGVLPFPNNLLLSGTADLTLNIPVADPTDFSDPQVALSALDGFSTTSPWTLTFTAPIAPASVVPGGSVRVYEVSLIQGGIGVTGVNRELTPGEEYVAAVSSTDPDGRTLAIVPLEPLQQMTAYMAVVTNGITDTQGNPATPTQPYFLAKRTNPLVDADGNSTEPLLDDATAQSLEPLRQIISSQESAAVAAGVDRDSIVASWSMTTQSVTPVLSQVTATAAPANNSVVPTNMTTADVLPPDASPGIADIYIGTITLPYYLGVPGAGNPTAPLTEFWTAEPGAYVPPFDGFGLDPTSTHVTVANPFPVVTDMQTVPVLMTLPNAGSGQSMPASGWPVVIYQHGITRNRSDVLAIADTLAGQGFAAIAMDLPLHGITDTELGNPEQPLAALYIENTPFGPVANERTFDLDLQNNQTGAQGPDGNIDGSGSWFINLQSLLTSRDNLRQGQADLTVLAATIPTLDVDGDDLADFDGSNINFVGQSLGAITGIPFLSVEPTVGNGVLSAPGGGIVNFLVASETFGPRIIGGLEAAGVEPFSDDFYSFLGAAQTVLDSADPINWGETAVQTNSILLHEVIGDSVIPNAVDGSPLSGTEPLIRIMALDNITATTQDPMGVRGATRFIEGGHGSLLDPMASPAVTAEMQGQMASMIASGGTTVVVNDPSVIQPE